MRWQEPWTAGGREEWRRWRTGRHKTWQRLPWEWGPSTSAVRPPSGSLESLRSLGRTWCPSWSTNAFQGLAESKQGTWKHWSWEWGLSTSAVRPHLGSLESLRSQIKTNFNINTIGRLFHINKGNWLIYLPVIDITYDNTFPKLHPIWSSNWLNINYYL